MWRIQVDAEEFRRCGTVPDHSWAPKTLARAHLVDPELGSRDSASWCWTIGRQFTNHRLPRGGEGFPRSTLRRSPSEQSIDWSSTATARKGVVELQPSSIGIRSPRIEVGNISAIPPIVAVRFRDSSGPTITRPSVAVLQGPFPVRVGQRAARRLRILHESSADPIPLSARMAVRMPRGGCIGDTARAIGPGNGSNRHVPARRKRRFRRQGPSARRSVKKSRFLN
jgi:hypothetical protein